MSDYKSKSAFGEDVLPTTKAANFTNLTNKTQNPNTKPVNGSAKFNVQLNNGDTNAARVNSAIKSDAPAGSNGGAFKGFIGGK